MSISCAVNIFIHYGIMCAENNKIRFLLYKYNKIKKYSNNISNNNYVKHNTQYIMRTSGE